MIIMKEKLQEHDVTDIHIIKFKIIYCLNISIEVVGIQLVVAIISLPE